MTMTLKEANQELKLLNAKWRIRALPNSKDQYVLCYRCEYRQYGVVEPWPVPLSEIESLVEIARAIQYRQN